jgi:GNAT superfamily N-acetyltransferase
VPTGPGSARVRLATEPDLPRLVELLAQLSLDTPSEQRATPLSDSYRRAFDEVAADPRQQLFVVEDGGRVVGSACLIVVPNLSHQGTPYALVENVVVDQGERSAGYGELLMRHAMAEAQRAGCYKLTLTSNKRRPAAHRFYERLGFTATSEGFRIDL